MLLVAPLRPLMPQTSSEQQLQSARELYDQLQIEQAMPLLRQLLSPAWPFELTAAQRVEAYKYVGAVFVLIGKADSATLFFRAALERDPFADLDPARFTPRQIAVFAGARRLTFSVGVRPIAAATVDPRTERVAFTIATTHAAIIEAALQSGDTLPAFSFFTGPADGLTPIEWDGLRPGQTLAPPGRYQLTVMARSSVSARVDTARAFFDLEHQREPLEDTLPDLAPGVLLPERAPPGAAAGELVKGLGVAGAVFTIATGLSSARLGDVDRARPAVVAAVGVGSGVVAFLARRRHRDLPANIAENARRRGTRETANAAIRARNAQRIAATLLVIRPAAGIAP